MAQSRRRHWGPLPNSGAARQSASKPERRAATASHERTATLRELSKSEPDAESLLRLPVQSRRIAPTIDPLRAARSSFAGSNRQASAHVQAKSFRHSATIPDLID